MKLDKAAILIKKAALEFDKMANADLSAHELTAAQYKVIKYIYSESDKGVRITDLEKYFSMSHPTVIGIVQNLEKKGLIEYRENPDDGRSRFIVPSEEAVERKDELFGIGESIEKKLTSKLSSDERNELIHLLRKMLGLDEE